MPLTRIILFTGFSLMIMGIAAWSHTLVHLRTETLLSYQSLETQQLIPEMICTNKIGKPVTTASWYERHYNTTCIPDSSPVL